MHLLVYLVIITLYEITQTHSFSLLVERKSIHFFQLWIFIRLTLFTAKWKQQVSLSSEVSFWSGVSHYQRPIADPLVKYCATSTRLCPCRLIRYSKQCSAVSSGHSKLCWSQLHREQFVQLKNCRSTKKDNFPMTAYSRQSWRCVSIMSSYKDCSVVKFCCAASTSSLFVEHYWHMPPMLNKDSVLHF